MSGNVQPVRSMPHSISIHMLRMTGVIVVFHMAFVPMAPLLKMFHHDRRCLLKPGNTTLNIPESGVTFPALDNGVLDIRIELPQEFLNHIFQGLIDGRGSLLGGNVFALILHVRTEEG